MTMTVLITAVIAFFATFAGVMGFAQFKARGIVAPGALPFQ